jgi:flagellar hook-associated protein 3 FlgL
MRISTGQIFQQSLQALLEQQSKVSQTELQLSSGRKILNPSDDPAAAARALDLNQSLEAVRQYLSNAEAARARLALTEDHLAGAGDLLQRVHELALQANNDSQTSDSRRTIAQELRARLDELAALANGRDANGEYLFAGYQGQTQPFVRSGGGFSYQGDDGHRLLQIGANAQVAISDSGRDLFQRIRNGNGTLTTADDPANTGSAILASTSVTDPSAWVEDSYTITFLTPASYEVRDSGGGLVTSGAYTSGTTIAFNGVAVRMDGAPATNDRFTVSPSVNQDLFATVQNLITALEGPQGSAAALAKMHNAVNRGLADLDQGLGHMLEARTQIGARLNLVETHQELHQNLTLSLEQTLSEVQDLDYAEAISRFNRQLLALQAAQQSFARIQDLSLFNFLR